MKSLLLISIFVILTHHANAEAPLNEEKAISIVKELYSSDIESAESIDPKWANTEIEVFLTDLNNDKKNEIFAVIHQRFLCGSRGCMTVLLEKKEGNWQSILGRMITHGYFESFDETHNGYKLINFGEGYPKLKYINGRYQFEKP